MKPYHRNVPTTTKIPIKDASVAMLVWEVFELRENYGKLYQLLIDLKGKDKLKAQQAPALFASWTGHVAEQVVGYQRSIEVILDKRGWSHPKNLDALEALALTCEPNDKLVCQVAMLKCYVALNEALASNQAAGPGLACIGKTCRAVEVWVVQRVRVEQELADAAVQPFRLADFRVDDWVCSSNPYGAQTSGPEWEISLAMPSPATVIH